ncbi:MAG: hypothetical protein CMM28_14470 [Rhodospirillaceae bacterium]|nr:hypothetical protein [Rhodospirillaceae bacterium]
MTVAGCIPVLIEEWQIGAAEAGSIVSGFYFAYAFSLMGFSWLGDHIGAKRAVEISAWITTFASVSFGCFANDFASSLIFYSLLGLSQGGIYTPLIALFRENSEPNRLGTAIGWLIASTSVGYATSLLLTGLSLAYGGWQFAFLLTGLLPAIGTLLLLIVIRPLPNKTHNQNLTAGLWSHLRRNRKARKLIIGYTAHNWEMIGMWTWAPALISASFVFTGTTTALATQWSTQLTTLMHVFGALAAYFFGKLSDILGRRTILIWTAAVSAIFSCGIGFTVTGSPYVISLLVLIYAAFCLGDSPVLSTALAESVEPAYLGTILALRSLVGFIAAAVAPLVAGWVIDLLNDNGASAMVIWGGGFLTFGVGGLLATLYALHVPKDR